MLGVGVGVGAGVGVGVGVRVGVRARVGVGARVRMHIYICARGPPAVRGTLQKPVSLGGGGALVQRAFVSEYTYVRE